MAKCIQNHLSETILGWSKPKTVVNISFMHRFTSFYMWWVFFISQKNYLSRQRAWFLYLETA